MQEIYKATRKVEGKEVRKEFPAPNLRTAHAMGVKLLGGYPWEVSIGMVQINGVAHSSPHNNPRR